MSDLDLGISYHGADEQSGNVFVVETVAKAGMMLQSHQHAHGHLSVLVSGTALVDIDGHTEQMTGYRLVTIPPGVRHSICAVTDVIWLCLWSGDEAPRDQVVESLKLVGNYG
jgi:quercetin dioxygenase-like cupin family protein